MEANNFYGLMFDNIPYGVYVLDDKGNYLYVNTAYVKSIGTSKQEILFTNVQEFVKRKEIPFCVSDIVYKEKRRISLIQEADLIIDTKKTHYKHLIVSTPIFGDAGKIQNIIAICIPITVFQEFYDQAEKNGYVFDFSRKVKSPSELNTVIVKSDIMKYLLNTAQKIAKTDTSVLLSGDSGTGKEVIAKYIHEQSLRADKKLVIINCASLPENLLEAELFGYEKGAFTGAAPGGKIGLLETAEGGTLFLDEINSLPISLQGKLLRVLETKTIQRIGSTRTKTVDFRLISATNENLEEAIEQKRFRLDLYYRLNVIPLHIPPLRSRRDDIHPLAEHFLSYYCKKYQKNKKFTGKTIEKMEEYDWPGNVRELRNFVERMVVMSAGTYIDAPGIVNITSMIESGSSEGEYKWDENIRGVKAAEEEKYRSGVSLTDYLEKCERDYVQYALNHCKSTYAAADYLGVSQSCIMRKKRKYSI